MRKLTETDLENIIGSSHCGYTIARAKIKVNSEFSDSGNYGIALGKSEKSGGFVTWQFHLLEDGSVSFYWGRYFSDENSADADYEKRE